MRRYCGSPANRLRRRSAIRSGLVLSAALLLAGCKTFSADGGMQVVARHAGAELDKELVAIRTPDQADAARERVLALLRRPLTADAAVQIALYNNRGLQASYNALGIAEAEMIAASLPAAPAVSLERMSNPLELEIERRIVANILSLLTLPARASIAADRFHQAQLRAAEDTIRVAAEARRAYYRAIAAREIVAFLEQSASAAQTASRLARRLGETGAMNKLDQAREQSFYAEIAGDLGRARMRSDGERETLVRALGLWGDDLAFRLPSTLPSLPGQPRSLPDVEALAVERRIDLQIARMELDALAKAHGLTQASRFIDLLEVAGIRKTVREKASGEKERTRGAEIELRIPIFDFGETRVRLAEQTYLQAVNRLAEKAVNARSHARDAYRGYRSSYDVARHYRGEVLPLRAIISEETLLRYNAMQVDVFALLAESRQRMAVNLQAIDAQRNFWLASVDLGVAIVGGGPTAGSAGESMTVATANPGAEAGH